LARKDEGGAERTSTISRRDTPEVMTVVTAPPKKEGAGNAGCALHPRSRVQKSGETHTSIQGSGEHPTFPAQWFDGLCRALPGDEFLFASITGGLKDCQNPVGSTLLRRLDTSNGCRDHTVLPYAAVRLSPGWRRSSARLAPAHGREARPATTTRARRCRVHRNPSLVRDDGQRPSWWDGMGEVCKGDLGAASRENSVNQKLGQTAALA
jgi:hypothetical protein